MNYVSCDISNSFFSRFNELRFIWVEKNNLEEIREIICPENGKKLPGNVRLFVHPEEESVIKEASLELGIDLCSLERVSNVSLEDFETMIVIERTPQGGKSFVTYKVS